MEEKRIPVQDVLRAAIGILEDIPVPIKLNQTIGRPIADVIGALSQCVEAIEGGAGDGNDHAE